MKTIQTSNGTKIQFFNNLKEISAKRWNAFNTECIKYSTLGATFEEAATKLDAMNAHLRYQNSQAYQAENENLRLQLFGMYHGINTKMGALIYLVKSIDGVDVDPFSTDMTDLIKTLEDTEISEYDAESLIWDIRKK